jgi:hypothetical protein
VDEGRPRSAVGMVTKYTLRVVMSVLVVALLFSFLLPVENASSYIS